MTSYIDLTNKLLRRINESEMDETQFSSARGIHATAKDAIIDTIKKISNKKTGWIYNAVEHTQVLTIGQEEYPWPVRFNSVDWTSFQIQKDDVLDQEAQVLKYIERTKWYDTQRDWDYTAGAVGRGIPYYVFSTHGQGWGITPSPDKEYTVKYRYFKNPDDPILPTDIVTIPDKFDYVIISGGLYHMVLFKNDPEATAMARSEFNDNLNDMIRSEISWPKRVTDTRFGP